MGLFSRKIKNPVHGNAQIVACSRHAGDGRWQNCRMQLVVHVDGQAPYSAEVHQIAPRAKWPQAGMMVPVHIAPDDRDRIKVDFDSMETGRDVARRLADEHVAGHGQNTMPGMDLNGDDRIAQLERLASLRDSGALSDDEFEHEKRRLLGG